MIDLREWFLKKNESRRSHALVFEMKDNKLRGARCVHCGRLWTPADIRRLINEEAHAMRSYCQHRREAVDTAGVEPKRGFTL